MRKLSEPSNEDFDEHNSPTEPMSAIILSPHSVPTSSMGGSYTIPAPLPPELPFPQNGQLAAPYAYSLQTPGVYPVLPPVPIVHGNGRPPGGAGFSGERVRPLRSQPRRSAFPMFVGVLFLLAQLILLTRVILLLFGVPTSNLLIELVYAAGALLAWPLRLLVEHVNFPAQIGGDLINYLSALIAILAYGVLGRIMVRFLKALLNSR